MGTTVGANFGRTLFNCLAQIRSAFCIHRHSAQKNSALSEIVSPLSGSFRGGQCRADSPTVRNFSQWRILLWGPNNNGSKKSTSLNKSLSRFRRPTVHTRTDLEVPHHGCSRSVSKTREHGESDSKHKHIRALVGCWQRNSTAGGRSGDTTHPARTRGRGLGTHRRAQVHEAVQSLRYAAGQREGRRRQPGRLGPRRGRGPAAARQQLARLAHWQETWGQGVRVGAHVCVCACVRVRVCVCVCAFVFVFVCARARELRWLSSASTFKHGG